MACPAGKAEKTLEEKSGSPSDDHCRCVDVGDEVHAKKREADALENRRCLPNGCRPRETGVLSESNLKENKRKTHKYVACQPRYEEST